MIRIAFVGLAVLGSVSATQQRPQQDDVAPFRMTLESTPTGWSGHCDSGCAWIEATIGCPNGCDVLVDAYGLAIVTALPPPPRDSSAFLFVAKRTGGEVRAVARHGTAWTTIGWSCDAAACRAVVNGFGVSGTRAQR